MMRLRSHIPVRKALSVLPMTVFLMALVAASAGRAAAPEPMQDEAAVDTSRWHCSLCPYREGWYGVLDFGLGDVGDTSLKYADYRGLDERGAFPALDGAAHYRDSQDHYLDFFARDLGLDSRSLALRAGLRGRYQFRLDYHEIPKYRGYGTETVYSGIGSDRLELPANWQSAFSTDGMTALSGSLVPAPLKTLRRNLQAGLTLKFPGKWTYDLNFQHETKDGTRPFGAGLYLLNTSQFPVPVDFTTDGFNMGLERDSERAHLRLGFTGSRFDNGVDSITWENPFSSEPANHLLRAALAPDNKAYQFSLQGAFAPRPGVHLSGRAALGRMRQDDPLLPYSINPDFGDLTLPRPTAGLDVGTLNIAGKLSARLAPRLNLQADAKIDQRNNHSPVDVYTIVITDFVPGGDRLNRPYSYKRETYDVEMNYRAAAGVSVRGGSGEERYRRTLQSVRETRERTYWGELNLSHWSAAQLRVKLETSTRDASPYVQVDKTGLIENPLMRKFQYADRDRNRAVVELDLMPGQIWSANLSWSRAQDDYSSSMVGLHDSDEENFSLDLGGLLGARISFNAYASRENISSTLSGFDAGIEAPWNAFTHDRITTLGLNLSGRISKRLSLGLDWMEAASSGRIAVVTSEADQPFPALRTRLGDLRGHVSFDINHEWSWRLAVEYERLRSSDWQIDDLGAAGISQVLTLGGLSPRYSLTTVRLQASYRF